ncbi:hypothetical protein BVRB_4g079340 [Beta vulgaris subsp. vulgaris]|nr:hypothetical protein BVRB_4g079340 [Beta vulgaris subsp. vulgaris]
MQKHNNENEDLINEENEGAEIERVTPEEEEVTQHVVDPAQQETGRATRERRVPLKYKDYFCETLEKQGRGATGEMEKTNLVYMDLDNLDYYVPEYQISLNNVMSVREPYSYREARAYWVAKKSFVQGQEAQEKETSSSTRKTVGV